MKKSLKSLLFLTLCFLVIVPQLVLASSTIDYGSDSLVDSEIIRNEIFEDSLRFREMVGFNKEIDYVSNLVNSYKSNLGTELYGVPLTDAELEELFIRSDVSKELSDFKLEFKEKFGEDFGGVYIDQENGGIVNFGIVNLSDKENLVNFVKKEFAYKDRIKFFNAKFSYDELKSTQVKMREYYDILGIHSTYIDEELNGVVVNLNDQRAIDAIHELFGKEIIIIEDEVSLLQEMNRDAKTRPLEGGLRILNYSGDNYCTGSFSAEAITGGKYYITAGHCGYIDDGFMQGGERYDFHIGTVGRRNFGGNSDALAMSISSSNASRYLYGSHNMFRNVIVGTQALDADNKGDIVVYSGITSGIKSGTITSTSADGSHESGTRFTNLREVRVKSQSGDSGSPVYNNSSNHQKTILGVAAFNRSKLLYDYTYYSHVQHVLRDLNLVRVVQ